MNSWHTFRGKKSTYFLTLSTARAWKQWPTQQKGSPLNTQITTSMDHFLIHRTWYDSRSGAKMYDNVTLEQDVKLQGKEVSKVFKAWWFFFLLSLLLQKLKPDPQNLITPSSFSSKPLNFGWTHGRPSRDYIFYSALHKCGEVWLMDSDWN